LNYKEDDKKIPFFITAIAKERFSKHQYEQLMPLVLPYQNAENAFRVILGDLLLPKMEQELYYANFGADDAKVAKEATSADVGS
jgi:isoleucyl-tRNA synthetase